MELLIPEMLQAGPPPAGGRSDRAHALGVRCGRRRAALRPQQGWQNCKDECREQDVETHEDNFAHAGVVHEWQRCQGANRSCQAFESRRAWQAPHLSLGEIRQVLCGQGEVVVVMQDREPMDGGAGEDQQIDAGKCLVRSGA
jgi:hypothetical protein